MLPGYDFMLVDDSANVPYGEKDAATIIRLTEAAIKPLLGVCPVIVIACNTATAAAIDYLRTTYPDTQFVGVEPMVKPASLGSAARHITVLATPFTLASERYIGLRERFATGVTIDTPSTIGWPKLIDNNDFDRIDYSVIDASIESGSDTIVLACTHFIGLVEILTERYPNATIMEPTEALARRIEYIIHDI